MTQPNYKTIEGLKRHPLYVALTPRMAQFLLAYIETNGDRAAAVKAAGYRCKTQETSDLRAHLLLGNHNIRALLAEYYGIEIPKVPVNLREAKELISEQLRNKKLSNSEFMALMRTYGQIEGWLVREATLAPLQKRKKRADARLARTRDDISGRYQSATKEKVKDEKEQVMDLVQQLEAADTGRCPW